MEIKEFFRYKVGIENDYEHINLWEYTEEDFDLAKARYDSLVLSEDETKYLYDNKKNKYLFRKFKCRKFDTKQKIYDYLGVDLCGYTTKEDKETLKEIIKEFKQLEKQYKYYKLCFIDDLGTYIEFNKVIKKGEYIAVYK